MRGIVAGAAVLVLLAACSSQTPAEKAAEDARAVAQVEAAQRNGQPPVKPIDPQPIMFFDIRDGKLTGTGCNFVADGGGMGAILLAQDERGVMKLDGKLVIFASDKGSTQLPQGAWSRYSGKEYALTLTRIDDGKAVKNGLVDLFSGQVVVTDPFDRVVYKARGNVQCKPM